MFASPSPSPFPFTACVFAVFTPWGAVRALRECGAWLRDQSPPCSRGRRPCWMEESSSSISSRLAWTLFSAEWQTVRARRSSRMRSSSASVHGVKGGSTSCKTMGVVERTVLRGRRVGEWWWGLVVSSSRQVSGLVKGCTLRRGSWAWAIYGCCVSVVNKSWFVSPRASIKLVM